MSLNWVFHTGIFTGKNLKLLIISQMKVTRDGDIRYHIDFGKKKDFDIYAQMKQNFNN